jgi:hypothetical protein
LTNRSRTFVAPGKALIASVVIEQDAIRQMAHVVETPLGAGLLPHGNMAFPRHSRREKYAACGGRD